MAYLRLIRVAAALTMLSLGACSTASPPPAKSTLQFDGQAIRLDVARIEVVTEYTSPLKPPNVEHLMPIPPAMAAKRWAETRFQAVGTTRVAKLLVQDGSVVEVPLKKTEGVKGFFTTDQEARFDGKLAVTLTILDDRAFGLGTALAEASRSHTLPEKATLNQRDKLYYELTDDLMRDIDAVMQKQLTMNLQRFVLQ